ncbi:hypothetical protein NCCP2716_01280 [Sporosarcina sp. NCCP-2716]|uniref:ATP-binding protein n=1 Tax=Sporosarcina sp. NCCP-2716 TaxID=2943679 RepID=UPI0020421D88|nr:ATP-binding protein [Sporosarcina sp. NCCP-2716]GKV67630.1 hypothetical protein NCCP2716_01280 [Sporosarcina sp. NCCP-2716]
METAFKSMSLFVKENRNPCILVEKDGTIVLANTLFKNKFSLHEDDNFLTRITVRQSLQDWYDILKNSEETEVVQMDNFAISIRDNVECLCKAHVFYSRDKQQAVVTFILPASEVDIPSSVYASSFGCVSKTILLVSREGQIMDVNHKVTSLFNMSRKELVGRHVQTIYRKLNTLKDDAERVYADYVRRLQTFGEAMLTGRFEKDPNDIKFFEIRSSYNMESDIYVVEVKDCTETEMLRKQLEHSGSLSTVGQMAASIAHEIRNPMTTLKGFVQLMEVTATGDTAKYLEVVDSELQRMEAILNEMLMLSKPTEEKYSEFSLGVLITKVLEIMKPKAMFESIEIDWQDSSFCNSMIYSNADKLKQVLLNLFKNAFEAMGPGGVLTLKLEKGPGEHSFSLTVTDTGKGMSELQVKNMFMPFFTSKPEGTGLGLPFVLKTMEDLGGSVAVTSQLELGTTFMLVFPVHCMQDVHEITHLPAN